MGINVELITKNRNEIKEKRYFVLEGIDNNNRKNVEEIIDKYQKKVKMLNSEMYFKTSLHKEHEKG